MKNIVLLVGLLLAIFCSSLTFAQITDIQVETNVFGEVRTVLSTLQITMAVKSELENAGLVCELGTDVEGYGPDILILYTWKDISDISWVFGKIVFLDPYEGSLSFEIYLITQSSDDEAGVPLNSFLSIIKKILNPVAVGMKGKRHID